MEQLKKKRTFEKAVQDRDAFEFCRRAALRVQHRLPPRAEPAISRRASCRTSSKSTVHGNAYMSEYRCAPPAARSGPAAWLGTARM